MIEVIISFIGRDELKTRMQSLPREGEHIIIEESRYVVTQVQHHLRTRDHSAHIICGGDINHRNYNVQTVTTGFGGSGGLGRS
jgi:hypothetical protein